MDPEDAEKAKRADEPPLLPRSTRDDTDEGWGERSRERDREHDDWLQEQRPPHWD